MKFIKTVIITLLVMAILFTGVFMAGRYGWKVFGFRACEEAVSYTHLTLPTTERV